MRRLALLLLLAFAPAARAEDPAPAASPAPSDPHRVVHGMTISCPTWGGEWGTDEMVRSMEKLRDLGCNWITIHPYAGIRGDGAVTMWERAYEETTWLTRPIAEAHRLGLKIMIKPHIAYWGSPFSWRGEIAFEGDEAWARFFATYERWIVEVARITRDADAFVVGTELDATIEHEADWRRVIAAVRGETDAPLTYSANWDRYEQVAFWDALDVIGIQSYFPLVDHDRLPEPAELDRGWRRVLREIDAYATRHDRPVVLAELGYNRSAAAAVRPWDYHSGGAQAEEVQRRCLAAALRALEGHDRVVGAFLWKWFPGERSRSNFIKSTPAMQAVIREHWGPPGTG